MVRLCAKCNADDALWGVLFAHARLASVNIPVGCAQMATHYLGSNLVDSHKLLEMLLDAGCAADEQMLLNFCHSGLHRRKLLRALHGRCDDDED